MTDSHYDSTPPTMELSPCGTDGAFDRVIRLGHRPKSVPAIFIHAGAGFHSHQNEHVHLQACAAAAEMGMKFLKAGSTATEAIEASLRILEDKEITNAGYGSNLSIDGMVECDATIVDHLGRSGACGAVPNIRNPISLAKLILDRSNKPLSLRRVPPNALVGDGARSFAEEHGLATFSNDYLVSKNARDRFLRWQDDLKRAEFKSKETKAGPSSGQSLPCVPCQYETASRSEVPRPSPRDYAAAVRAGTWNEGQPDSPYTGTPLLASPDISNPQSPSPSLAASNYFRMTGSSTPTVAKSSVRASPDRSPFGSLGASLVPKSLPQSQLASKYAAAMPLMTKRPGESPLSGSKDSTMNDSESESQPIPVPHRDGSASPLRSVMNGGATENHSDSNILDDTGFIRVKRPRPSSAAELGRRVRQKDSPSQIISESRDDHITDTIGAIAIDDKGQIAAGSSSGGIGMKHQGRLGPAALVGVGTAVVPCDEEDEDEISVAAVTSGTGEHMATTMASQRCAERIYHGNRRGKGGLSIQDDDEDAIIESFISKDFMNHPGVRSCHSASAIGVMVVKKTRTGYYFYFAHNTDSFALASMGGNEKEPRCTMSRLPDGGNISQGGRKIRLD